MGKQDTRTIWVTGASSGIGRAIALQLGREGHRVYISARNREALDSLVSEMPGNLIALPCDVTDDAAMAPLLRKNGIAELDMAILCAGVCEYIDLPHLDMGKVRRVAETNYFGTVNACIAALPALKSAASAGRKPQLVGIGSMSSYVGFPRAEAYGSSKAAMSYFLQSLRSDLGREISVTVVYPGFVATPMTGANDFPMPFLVSAEKAAVIILAKAAKRPLSIAFPSRLHLLLQAMRLFPRLWYSAIATRLSRQGGAHP